MVSRKYDKQVQKGGPHLLKSWAVFLTFTIRLAVSADVKTNDLSYFPWTIDSDASCKLSPNITKTCLYNFDPLKPHFYIVKLGNTGVYIIFLIFAKT